MNNYYKIVKNKEYKIHYLIIYYYNKKQLWSPKNTKIKPKLRMIVIRGVRVGV